MIKVLLQLVRWAPVVVCMLMTLHCLLLLCGIDLPLLRYASTPLLSAVVLWVLSQVFRFCLFHQICINYCFAAHCCIIAKRLGFFAAWGVDIDFIRFIMLLSGISILIILAYAKRHRGFTLSACRDFGCR